MKHEQRYLAPVLIASHLIASREAIYIIRLSFAST